MHFKNDPFNRNSLSDDFIEALILASDGNLWAGTWGGGINILDPVTGNARRYMHNPKDTLSILSDYIRCIYQDNQDIIWIGTSKGFAKYSKGKFINYPLTSVYAFFREKEILWLATDKGLIRYNITKKTFDSYLSETHPNLKSNSIYAIVNDGNLLWLGTRSAGLVKFDKRTQSFTAYSHEPGNPASISENYIEQILIDKIGRFWVGTVDGLNLFDKETGTFQVIKNDFTDEYSLSGNSIMDIFEDRAGDIWVGTYLDGVNKLSPKKFVHIRNNPSEKNSLSENKIWAVCEDRSGLIWIGTETKGLSIYDRKNNTFTNYMNIPGRKGTLSSNSVQVIFEDSKGIIWAGTKNGLNRFNPESKTFTVFNEDKNNPGSLSDDDIVTISEDNEGYLWVGTYFNGLNRFNTSTYESERFVNKPGAANSLGDNSIRALFIDSENNLWIATGLGLTHFDRRSKNYRHFLHNDADINSISSNRIYSVFEDTDRILWIGTNNGLNRYDPETGHFKYFSEKDGLANPEIYCIEDDEAGNLWLSTNKGITKFNKITGRVINYDEHDGLQGTEFNMGASFRNNSGVMYFGGLKGLNIFHPAEIYENKNVPPVYIKSYKIFNKEYSLSGKDYLELSYNQNFISFEFVALDYMNPSQNRYQYKLEGYDSDWNDAGTRNIAYYTNLDGGKYTFRVRGSNNDNIWNLKGDSLALLIHPPFWKTWWAYTIYILLAGFSIFMIIYRRMQIQKRKIQEKEKELYQEKKVTESLKQLNKLKDEFLANTSHELRTPLNGIIGIVDSMMDGAAGVLNDLQKLNLNMVNISARRLNNLVNDILDFSKLKHKNISLSLKPVDVKTISDIVFMLSKPLAAGKDIQFINKIDKVLPVNADENRLQQILFNLVGNAVKFTEKGFIEISAEKENGFALIHVKDTGIGIRPENISQIFEAFEQADGSISRNYGGTGLGLNITKSLVELHGGKIRVESEFGKGSDFIITIPLTDEKPADLGKKIQIEQVNRIIDTEVEDLKILPGEDLLTNKKYKILIVDDETVNLQVLTNYLSLQNYEINFAHNGAEAMKLFKQDYIPDLAIIDVMMPGMSGYELTQNIRIMYDKNILPIILLTAKNRADDLLTGFEAGANDYLVKPFSKRELIARIKNHLYTSKVSSVYEKFVPKEFINQLDKESILDIQLGDQVLKDMTVLFCDIRSFTTLSEKMDPQDNFNFINAYLKRIEPSITRNDGFIDKYIGDAVMALFPGDPVNAVNAAAGMLSSLAVYNEKRIKEGKQAINIGIGIHSGSLMLGTIGVENRMEGTVISDNVNLASRLEGLNKTYGTSIIISEQVLRQSGNPENMNVRYIDKVNIIGRVNTVRIYEVIEGIEESVKKIRIRNIPSYNKGMELMHSGNYLQASEIFTEILKHDPDDKLTKYHYNECLRKTDS